MRTGIILIATLIVIIGVVIMQTTHGSFQTSQKKPVRVLLLGASVGRAWNLPEWPIRMHNNDYAMEMIAEYAFDKSKALEEIFMRPKRKFHMTRSYIKSLFEHAPQKPDILIIKECAAYFPGDLEDYKAFVKKWVAECESNGIRPVLATVVPVTEEHSERKPGRLEGILKYNDWIKVYAKETGTGVLDLEEALRISVENRVLKPELTSGDGLHLNTNAYYILDKVLGDQLKEWILHPCN